MQRALQPTWMLPISLAVVCGYLLAAYADVYGLVAIYLLVAGISCILPAKTRGRIRVCLLVSLLAVGYFQLYDHIHQSACLALAAGEKTVQIEGAIDSAVKQDGDTVSFYLQATSADGIGLGRWPKKSERIAVRLKLTQAEQIAAVNKWSIGDSLEGELKLTLPQANRNPGAFNYARYLRWQGVYVIGEAAYPSVRHIRQFANLWGWFDRWQRLEEAILEQIYPDQETAGYLKSLLLGVTDEVDPQITDLYSRMGLLHVLAISGLHVTMVSACWMWGLKRLGLSRKKSACLGLVFLTLYVLLVGASSSAVRSGIMGGIGLLAVQSRRQISMVSVWSIALTVMLFASPYQLWQAGFQLSFAVTLGLILYVPMLAQLRGRGPKWLFSSLTVTFSAQLVSFPILIYWFHQFSFLSWLINLIYVPIISFVILPLGYVSLGVAHVHPAFAYLISEFNRMLLAWLHHLLGWADQWQILFRHWPHPTWWWVVFYLAYCSFVPLCWYRGYHRGRDLLLYIACLLLLVVCARQPFTGLNEVRITFLDVGQGDSIIVEIGREKVYLIDSGGTVQPREEAWRRKKDPFDVGKDVVLPFLRSRGIEQLDMIVMTHPDNDHVGGFLSILPQMQIKSALINGDTPKEAEQKVLDYLLVKHIPVYTNRRMVRWQDHPDVTWTWLSPTESPQNSKPSGNDASIVLLLTAYGKNVLFTGDLEQKGEKLILMAYHLPHVDILKVGHHGSKTSTTKNLLEVITPKAAVISVGKHNQYHHPHPEVIRRLNQMKSTVYRTDEQGSITAIITSDGIKVEPFSASR